MTPADEHPWLRDIALVTFDCFGTLLDVRAALARTGADGPDDYARFGEGVLQRQQQARFVPYKHVVRDALREIRDDLRPAIAGLFGDDIGRAPAFADSARALATLQDLVRVGVLANSDASHQLDVAATLGIAWDVCLTSDGLRAYKPTEQAWDALVRMAIARTAATRDQWLHVSAFAAQDLAPARARGLRTCLVRRQGFDGAAKTDLVVDDLDALARLLSEAKQGPLVLRVRSLCRGRQREALRGWLMDTGLSAVRALPGVRDARLLEDDAVVEEHYVFGGRAELDNYRENHEPELRAARRAAVPDVESAVDVLRMPARG